MGIYKQSSDSKGSLKCIQELANVHQGVMRQAVCNRLNLKGSYGFTWKSPLKESEYAEYRDGDFIKRIEGDQNLVEALRKFWPNNGPQWDGLANGNDGKVFLMEAKANLAEIVSSACNATSPSSKALITDSLNETKKYLNIPNEINWMGKYYQYTNRLAHLYYLRVLNNIDAYMIFIYFVGDESVNGPKTREQWLNSIDKMEKQLGLDKKHMLKDYIIDVFIDVREKPYKILK